MAFSTAVQDRLEATGTRCPAVHCALSIVVASLLKAALHNSHGNLRLVRHFKQAVSHDMIHLDLLHNFSNPLPHVPIIVEMGRMQAAPMRSSLGDPSAGVSSRAPLQPLLPRHSPRTWSPTTALLPTVAPWHPTRLRWCCFPRRGQRFSKERKPPIASICGLRPHMYMDSP